ncbi:t-SNARE [Piptocephalis cylindrospora]|uniref:t-SNARE n=1 Tax=Piptocephalis cylindrospora TaxID=1907219 RepID=A0A4P9Y6R7_9FUNG|nr:t-SNARE [Piptocephalis cylindrospora]|eukprot:RKP14806.1 t-SNARE [Piptocephalis cylindrospora]
MGQGLLGDEERAGLMEQNSLEPSDQVTIEMSQLPPQWVDVMEELDEDLAGIHTQLTSLDALHRKHLLAGLEDDSPDQERAIEQLTTSITQDIRKAQGMVKRVGDASSAAGGDQAAEGVLAKNVSSAMAAKVQEVSATLRNRQSTYLDQLRGRESRTKEFLVDDVFKDDPSSAVSDSQDDSLSGKGGGLLTQEDIQGMEDMDSVIRARDSEISAISRSVAELADIFHELSSLVIDQGTLLDRIDYNIEQVHTHAKRGVDELDQGLSYQKRDTSRRFLFLIILLIAFLAIVIIVRFTGESPSTEVPAPIPSSGTNPPSTDDPTPSSTPTLSP